MHAPWRLWLKRTGLVITVAALPSGLLLVSATQLLGEEVGKRDPNASGTSVFKRFFVAIQERVEAAEGGKWVETADQVLIQKSQVQWRGYLKSVLKTPAWLDLGVEHRTRYENITNPFRKGELGTAQQIPQRTRVRLGLSGQVFRFLVEYQDSRTHLAGPGDFITTSVVNENDIQQLFVSATLRNVLGTGLRTDLHFGRINMDFGRRRLVARNRFRNTTNAFDGAHWNLAHEDAWRVRAFLVRPVNRRFGAVDVLFGGEDRLFWGLYYETHQVPLLETNLYYFGLNEKPPEIDSQRQYATFGFRLYQSPKKGGFDYEGESVWQVGTKRNKDHFAHFQHAELGYTFDARWTPRLVAQYDYASGTANPAGTFNQTFDTLFGARRFEYTPTGIFGPFFRSNISSPGVRVILKPGPAVKLTLKLRAWYLAQSRDAWVGSGLQDPTGGAGNVLGEDVELRVQYNPNLNLSVDAGYDHFFKGSYIQSLAKVPGNPPATDTDYFYIQIELKF